MSAPAGVIPGSARPPVERVKTDVVVIGSGASGGVVARELAERGARVLILEEGRWWDKDDYGRLPPSEVFRRIYRDAGFTVALGGPTSPSISLPIGRAVGGSTVINGGVCFRTPDDVLDRWWRDHGLAWSRAEVDAAFERVEDVCGIGPMPESILGGNARAFRRGCEAMGVKVEVMRRNTPGCDGCCRCIFGCPEDRKQAVHLSYIPRALAKGARVYADTLVTRIVVEGGRARGVEAVVIDRETAEPRGRLEVEADAVILAAGAVHTPGLLRKSRIADPSGATGRHLQLHPACRVLAEFDEPIDGHRGAFQGMFTKQWDKEDIHVNGIFLPPGIMAATLPFVGEKLVRALERYRHYAVFGVMVSDESEGAVHDTPFGPVLRYDVNDRDKDLLVLGVQRVARVWFAAGAKRVYPGLRGLPVLRSASECEKIRPSRFRATDLELGAFHPMGTCRMDPRPGRGVVRPDLRAHAVDRLWIPDASWFPTSIRVNPQVTIMAFATLCAQGIAGKSGSVRDPVANSAVAR